MAEEPIIKVDRIKKYFPVKKTIGEVLFSKEQKYVHAIDDVSFEIEKGEVFSLVGESGSGKTTTGKVCLGVYPPTSGKIFFEGTDISSLKGEEFRQFRRSAQMVYQDPSASLNPRVRIGEAIKEPLKFYKTGTKERQRDQTLAVLERVGLSPAENFYPRYPHELSGGQKQRVVIARSIILQPKFIVADEPVAMVDVSVRAQILELMLSLQSEFNLTYLLITHDLAIAKYFSNRIAIMYLGQIVEMGSRDDIFKRGQHPYTQALISSVPIPDPKFKGSRLIVKGEVPSPIRPPSGCRFHPRCPYARESCRRDVQALEEIENGHFVACEVKPFFGQKVPAVS